MPWFRANEPLPDEFKCTDMRAWGLDEAEVRALAPLSFARTSRLAPGAPLWLWLTSVVDFHREYYNTQLTTPRRRRGR